MLLEKNGVFAIVLECVSTSVAKQITQKYIPTIGIGSSVNRWSSFGTDDLLGINDTKIKFVKFLNLKIY